MKALLPSLATLISLCSGPLFAGKPAEKEPAWHKDLAQANALARQTKRPLFVVFR